MSCLYPRIGSVRSAFYDECMKHQDDKFWRDRQKINQPYAFNRVVFPCGKCMNCLKKKQDAFVVRIQEEAQKRGNMSFVTLTYDDDHLPLSQSLWRVDKLTGEMSIEHPASLLCNGSMLDCDPDPALFETDDDPSVKNKYRDLRNALRQMKAGVKPRYLEYQFLPWENFDENYDYYVRITPTVCRKDVRLWLKRCRVTYNRKFDKGEFDQPLNDFVYACIPEYGFKHCRPHYHIVFLGLSVAQVKFFCSLWKFGFTYPEYVNQIQPDKDGNTANGYQIVSRYISKYVTKGKFDCDSVADRCAEKPRLCQSHGIGSDIVDKVRDYVFCYDMFGHYNPDSLLLDSGDPLSKEQLNSIVSQIPHRLYYSPDGDYKYPLPNVFLNKLFREQIVVQNGNVNKTIFRPYKIWSLVQASLYDKFAYNDNRKYRSFLARLPSGVDTSDGVAFESYLQLCVSDKQKTLEERYVQELASSKY